MSRALLALSQRTETADAAAAAKLALMLRFRTGHIVVTGARSEDATQLFERAHAQVATIHPVRLSGGSLHARTVTRALEFGPDGRTDAGDWAVPASESRLVVVSDAHLAEVAELDRVCETLDAGTRAGRHARVVLLGDERLSEMLQYPAPRPLRDRMVAHVRVPGPSTEGATTVAAQAPAEPELRSQGEPEATPAASAAPRPGHMLLAATGAAIAAVLFLTRPAPVPPTGSDASTVMEQVPSPPEAMPVAMIDRTLEPALGVPGPAPSAPGDAEVAARVDPPPSPQEPDPIVAVPPRPDELPEVAPTVAPEVGEAEEEVTLPPTRPARPIAAMPASEPAAMPPRRERIIQVAAFGSAGNADALRARLSRDFEGVHVVRADVDGVVYHRVRIRARASEAESEALVAALRSRGHAPFLVRTRARAAR